MNIEQLLDKLHNSPELIEFSEVMACIDENYDFHETAFTNGEQKNASGENSGSCKVFSFAQVHNLDAQQTLALFGQYYRDDVLQHPTADNHNNIREFIQHGFAGLSFERTPLSKK